MARRRSRGSGSKSEREFVSEAEEILERMRIDLADLGEQRAAGGEIDPDVVNRLFRSAHSLKGLAGMFGQQSVHDLAHHLEDVLDGLRLGRVPLDSPATQLVERAAELFGELLASVGDDEALAAAARPAAALVAEIDALTRCEEGEDVLVGLDLDPTLLRALTEYEEHRLRENLRRGRHIALVDASFQIIAFEQGLTELSAELRQLGELLSTLPAPGDVPEAQIRFSLLLASDHHASEIATRLAMPGVAVRQVVSGRVLPTAPPRRRPAPAAEPATGSAAAGPVESLKSIADTVRVDIRKLDELMNLVGELGIQRGALGDLSLRLQATGETARLGAEVAKLHKAIDRKLRELQAAVLEVRMVPLRQVFEKVSRVVRRLRVELGKQVRLELQGADTELDKLLVEELVDPLMHIVRNSLDHGLEGGDERRAAGKQAEGEIRIEAFQRGNHVVISVSDDGRGIDREALRRSAEAAGLVAPDEVLSEREIHSLVFAPGISTNDQVTETSGRGVGMDVVRNNLNLLGGTVDVESVPGRGTTISLTLPITLAIVQSLIVRAGGERFAIPINAVLETLLVEPDRIQRSEGRELLDLRGDVLLLLRLDREFGLSPSEPPPEKLFAAVVGRGETRIGLLVDRLEGQQDTVIKPILGPVPDVRGIAGATEVGDQDPVLVLDVFAFLADAHGRREAA